MKTSIAILVKLALLVPLFGAASTQQRVRPLPNQFELPATIDVPVVLCIDDKPSRGGKPSTSAYTKAAANGFRSVLTLRTPGDGVDLNQERFMVEQNRMRYFNILAAKNLPQRDQVDEFLRLVRDKANHPMLINCAFAERVAPFMMIFRIVELGWTEKRAVEEASLSGLKSDVLRKFAKDYLAQTKKKLAGPDQRVYFSTPSQPNISRRHSVDAALD